MKTNRNIQLLLAVLLIMAWVITLPCALAVPANATSLDFAGGSGTEADPYLIETKEQLNKVDKQKYLKLIF